MGMKLTQLPNGDWLDLETVTGIRMQSRMSFPAGDTPSPVYLPARVCIDTRGGVVTVVNFESDDDAEAFRDELAGKVNGGEA